MGVSSASVSVSLQGNFTPRGYPKSRPRLSLAGYPQGFVHELWSSKRQSVIPMKHGFAKTVVILGATRVLPDNLTK